MSQVRPVMYRVVGLGVLTDSSDQPDTHNAEHECLPAYLDAASGSNEEPATPSASGVADTASGSNEEPAAPWTQTVTHIRSTIAKVFTSGIASPASGSNEEPAMPSTSGVADTASASNEEPAMPSTSGIADPASGSSEEPATSSTSGVANPESGCNEEPATSSTSEVVWIERSKPSRPDMRDMRVSIRDFAENRVDIWEAPTRGIDKSSEEGSSSGRHNPPASSSSENESPEALITEDVVDLAANDQSEGNSVSDDYAQSGNIQASSASSEEDRVTFAHIDDISEGVLEEIDEYFSDSSSDTYVDDDFGDDEEQADIDSSDDELPPHHTIILITSPPSPERFHLTSLPRSPTCHSFPQTSFSSTVDESEERPAETPICDPPYHLLHFDSGVYYGDPILRYPRISTTLSGTMPQSRPRLPPGLTDTPEVIRHQRYQARPGRCNHDSVLRFWIDESAPGHVCDSCGSSARFLWACNADTPDWSNVPSQTEEPSQPTGPDTSILAEWMQKAIAKGEYTPEQVQKLVDQKKQVFKCAAEDRAAQARGERVSTAEEETTDEAFFVRRNNPEVPAVPEDPSNGGPCRAMLCVQCHVNFVDRAFGHINQVANEPYAEPPTIPEYLNRPISDAATLREMRPSHWVRGYNFGLWWQENRYASGQGMDAVLHLALDRGLSENQFKLISWWVYWQGRSQHEVSGRTRWLEARSSEQMSSFSQSIADSRFIIPRSGERSRTEVARVLDPMLSISRHPIWEEDESQEGPVTTPDWEYSLGHRWQALSQREHRELTRLFIEQRDALARQRVSTNCSAAPSQ